LDAAFRDLLLDHAGAGSSAPAMHDDEVAQLTAEIERLRAEIRDLSRSTS
jgi:hypothetical protein